MDNKKSKAEKFCYMKKEREEVNENLRKAQEAVREALAETIEWVLVEEDGQLYAVAMPREKENADVYSE